MKERVRAAGILAIDMNSGRVLMVKRSPLCTHPGQWATVGGGIEEGEEPREAAIREFKEEVQPDEPYRLSKKPFMVTDDGHVKFYAFIGIFDSAFVPVLNEENSEYEWFDIDELPEDMLPACRFLFMKKRDELKEIIDRMSK